MSRTKIALLLLMLMALVVSACGGGATATPRPPTAEATEAVVESATDEATEEPTEEAVETEEAATEEATEAAETEEAATEEATEETVETEEAATEEATEVVEVALADDAMATASAVAGLAESAADDAMATASAVAGMAGDAMATASAVMAEVTIEIPDDALATVTAMAAEVNAAAGDAMATASAIAGMAEAAAADAMATASAVVAEATELIAEATLEPTAVPEEATEEASGLIPVKLQLQWVAQSQFAGYYAAVEQGYYTDEGLDVTILEGAVDIVPQQVVTSGGAEFGIAWVPKVLASREQGADLVNIAQVFQRSGTVDVSFEATGIESVEDLKGKNVGAWGFGNEHELFAALRGADIDPNNPDDVTIITQNFDMSALLSGEIDAAMAMTYNEYAQLLEQVNPETGELYQPEELNVINFNDVGTAMLQDHIFTSEAWLAGETDSVSNEDIAVKFIKASLKGWIYARDNFSDGVEIVLANGSTLPRGHQTWQLNEINKLIWPSPDGIGILDQALWDQTVQVALEGEVITEEPSEGAFRTDLAQKAVDELTDEGVDVTGEDWKAETVEITPGGE